MSRWRCPACDREFSRSQQSHTCVPGNSVEATFSGRPAGQREAYDAIVVHLATLGPLHVDAVRVGVFLSSDRKLAEVRPMARALTLLLMLPAPLTQPRVARRERISAERIMHTIKLSTESDVDDELKEWLAQAYDGATDSS